MNAKLICERVTSLNRDELHTACAVQDGHIVPPGATHMFRRDGQIVGAVSLFTPVAMFWAHTRLMTPHESLDLVNECKAMANSWNPDYLVACSAESPFRPHMEKRFGFKLIGGVEVFQGAR